MKLTEEQRQIRNLRRLLKQEIPRAIAALEREAESLHVREAEDDAGLQRAIRVLRKLTRWQTGADR